MEEFTPEMTLREVRKTPEFAGFAPFIMFCNEDPADDPVNPGKDPEDFTMKSDPVCATIDGLTQTSYTVPAGYHSGSGTVRLTGDIETALAAI